MGFRLLTLCLTAATLAAAGPVDDLAARLLGPEASSSFSFVQQQPSDDTLPCTQIASNGSVVEITGPNPNDLAHALGRFLRTECLMSFAWAKTGGHQLRMPAKLPALAAPVKLCRRVPYTYYQNVVTVSYSMWNWDWERWELGSIF